MNRSERKREAAEMNPGGDMAARTDEARHAVAVEVMSDEVKAEARRIAKEQARAIVTSPAFVSGVKDLIRASAMEIVKEILVEELPDLEERVRVILRENWEKQVASVAHAHLDDYLSAIRRKIG